MSKIKISRKKSVLALSVGAIIIALLVLATIYYSLSRRALLEKRINSVASEVFSTYTPAKCSGVFSFTCKITRATIKNKNPLDSDRADYRFRDIELRLFDLNASSLKIAFALSYVNRDIELSSLSTYFFDKDVINSRAEFTMGDKSIANIDLRLRTKNFKDVKSYKIDALRLSLHKSDIYSDENIAAIEATLPIMRLVGFSMQQINALRKGLGRFDDFRYCKKCSVVFDAKSGYLEDLDSIEINSSFDNKDRANR